MAGQGDSVYTEKSALWSKEPSAGFGTRWLRVPPVRFKLSRHKAHPSSVYHLCGMASSSLLSSISALCPTGVPTRGSPRNNGVHPVHSLSEHLRWQFFAATEALRCTTESSPSDPRKSNTFGVVLDDRGMCISHRLRHLCDSAPRSMRFGGKTEFSRDATLHAPVRPSLRLRQEVDARGGARGIVA